MPSDDVLQEVGPVDVDRAGELVKRVGVHNQAKALIKSVTDNFPPELVAAGSRRPLGGQSQTLDLAEVEDAARDAFDDFAQLLGAKARGSEARPERIAVNIVFRTKSGRSARGIIAYDELKKSKKAYVEAVKAGTVVIREDDPEANRKALEEAQRRIVALEAEDGPKEEPEGLPEPFEGYHDAKATQIVERVEEGEFSLLQLFALRAVEDEREDPRETILEAVSERIEAAEAALAEPDAEPEPEPEPYEGYAETGAKERVAKIQNGDLSLAELLAVRADQEALGDDLQKTVLGAAEEKITAAEEAIKKSDD